MGLEVHSQRVKSTLDAAVVYVVLPPLFRSVCNDLMKLNMGVAFPSANGLRRAVLVLLLQLLILTAAVPSQSVEGARFNTEILEDAGRRVAKVHPSQTVTSQCYAHPDEHCAVH